MLCLGKTCRAVYAAVQKYIAHAYRIERILSRFFDDPLEFRQLQAQTFTLISGSSALQFFDRSFYPSSDLDLWVHKPHQLEVGTWLLAQGYKFVPINGQDAIFETEILESDENSDGEYDEIDIFGTVFTFRKPNTKGDGDLKVEIIVAKRTPMECILTFHFRKCRPNRHDWN